MLHRADGLLDVNRLSKTHIVFIGLGSGGSYGFSLLPYQFRRIDLIDPDILEKHNVERHVLDRRSVGQPKVDAMRELMTYRGISGDTMFTHKCRAEDVLNRIPKPDILVVGIDDPVSQKWINAWCVSNDVPALYPSVYAKGSGGEVIVVPTPRSVCHQCAVVKMGMPAAKRPKGPGNYGVDIDALPTQVQAVPCLNWAITSIATEVARYVIQFVNGHALEPHVFVRIHDSAEVIRLDPQVMSAVSDFIFLQSGIGIQPLFTMKDGTLSIRHGSISHPLARWDRCPHHGERARLSLSDI